MVLGASKLEISSTGKKNSGALLIYIIVICCKYAAEAELIEKNQVFYLQYRR